MGAEQKFRYGIEKECGEAKMTVAKLRGKIDNLMVDAVRSRNSMEVMNQKAMMKLKEKQASSAIRMRLSIGK